MARQAAARRVTRRPRKPLPPSLAAGGENGAGEDARLQAPAKRSCRAGGFFCCYLLRSTCPRLKGRTYIGFTVNPRRRIRQHNGEISSGAWRTRNGRPWEMVLCIYGFPTNVAALQFEWAWQHPKESLAVRQAAAGFKSLSGAGNKVKLAYAMLNLPSWENLNLTVNFFSSTSTKFAAGCPPLPSQMMTVVCQLEDLQCHANTIRKEQGPLSEENNITAQIRTADDDLEDDNYSIDDFDLVERDGILDLTEPDRSSTWSQCSLSSNGGNGPSSQENDIIEDNIHFTEGPLSEENDNQGQDSLHRDQRSWKHPSSNQGQPMDAQIRTADDDMEDENYYSDDFDLVERDGILDLTEPDRSRTSSLCLRSNRGSGPSSQENGIIEDPQASQEPPGCHHGDSHLENSLNQPSTDQGQNIDAQIETTVYNVEDNYSSDQFNPMERYRILDLTEPDGSRTWPRCSLGSDGDGDGIVEDEVGHMPSMWKVSAGSADGGDDGVVDDELRPRSPVWNVCADSDGRDFEDELGQAVCPVWKDCAGSDGGALDHEFGLASPMLKIGTYSDCGDSGVTDDELGQASQPMMVDTGSEEDGTELGQASQMMVVDAASEEGGRDLVVDLVTPTPVGRLRRRAGRGSICHKTIDLTTSPAVIEL